MYSIESRVRYSEVDCEQKMTITALLNYFQDSCTFQSEDLDVGVGVLRQEGVAWMLISWQVVVERMPVFGEQIRVCTWPHNFAGFYGSRNFTMEDASGNVIAYANSVWTFMDIGKGRPCKVMQKYIDAYELEMPYEMEYKDRKIEIPQEYEVKEPITVYQALIDTNQHVNNERYIEMAKAYLPKEFMIREMRAEYRKSAVLGDVIYPGICVNGDIITVVLADEKKKPYVIVEFKEAV